MSSATYFRATQTGRGLTPPRHSRKPVPAPLPHIPPLIAGPTACTTPIANLLRSLRSPSSSKLASVQPRCLFTCPLHREQGVGRGARSPDYSPPELRQNSSTTCPTSPMGPMLSGERGGLRPRRRIGPTGHFVNFGPSFEQVSPTPAKFAESLGQRAGTDRTISSFSRACLRAARARARRPHAFNALAHAHSLSERPPLTVARCTAQTTPFHHTTSPPIFEGQFTETPHETWEASKRPSPRGRFRGRKKRPSRAGKSLGCVLAGKEATPSA